MHLSAHLPPHTHQEDIHLPSHNPGWFYTAKSHLSARETSRPLPYSKAIIPHPDRAKSELKEMDVKYKRCNISNKKGKETNELFTSASSVLPSLGNTWHLEYCFRHTANGYHLISAYVKVPLKKQHS